MTAPYRVVLSEVTTSTLKSLTQKTGLTANILARFAMLLSFEMPDPVVLESTKAGLTINRTTLFGDLEPFFMMAYALAGGRGRQNDSGREFSAHISRGVAFMALRINTPTDLLELTLGQLAEV